MGSTQVALVAGTRPELIKLARIVALLGDDAVLIHTGQHYDDGLRGQFLRELGMEPSRTLDIGGRSRGEQIGNAVSSLDRCLSELAPVVVVVQGDTNTALAGGIAANALDIPLVHVEAGLRSFDRSMPEEHNRVVVDHLAELCLAPTEVARRNLAAEGIPDDRVRVTGNTVVEAVLERVPDPQTRAAILRRRGLVPDGFVLSTFHRPENADDPVALEEVLAALADLALPVVLPLHPRTRARAAAFGLEGLLDRVMCTEPIGYSEFLGLAAESALLISDSGGLQEEASVLKRPLVVVRRSTERPEVMGTFAVLVGPERRAIVGHARTWLSDRDRREALRDVASPYGDGSASACSVEAIRELAGS